MYTASRQRQTDWRDAGAEPNRGAEGDDGKVILQGVWIEAGMPHEGDRQYSALYKEGISKRLESFKSKNVKALFEIDD